MAVWASVVFLIASLSLAEGGRQNVARGKPAWMSSRHYPSQTAGVAVDGVTSTSWKYSVHTQVNETTAWWKVDLQTTVQSPLVNIYFRTDYKRRRNGVQLYTSGTNSSDPKTGDLCHTVTGRADGSDIPDVLNVSCPRTWRYLTVYTETDNGGVGAVLDFVEVQVWDCVSGKYGEGCSKVCSNRHCKTSSDTCDHVTGQCPDGCSTGFTGDDCLQKCPRGKYGHSCTSVCGHCADNITCHHVTGTCPDGCQAGWKLPLCQTALLRDSTSAITPVTAGVIGLVAGICVTAVLAVGIHVGLVRQGRLQWMNSAQKNEVNVRATSSQVDGNSTQPSDNYTSISEQASARNIYNNDYSTLDVDAKSNNDYDVIKNKAYEHM